MLYIDGEELPLKKGIASVLTRRGNVACARRTTAPCVSSVFRPKAGSLEGFTMSDAVVTESGSKPSWL